jgi:hypothetical protein
VTSGVLDFFRTAPQCSLARTSEESPMKGMEKQKKETKKKPAKSLKEKRAEKHAKKAARS